MRYLIVIYCIVTTLNCFSQQTESVSIADTANKNAIDAITNIPDKSLDYIDKKYSKLSNDIQKQSEKLLKRIQDKEAKLQKKLQGIDSTKAKELFANSETKYQQLQSKVQGSVDNTTSKLKEYIPGLDSTNMAIKFLSQPDAVAGLTTDKLNRLSSVTGSVQELQGRLQQANEIQSFIRQRESVLKTALENTGLGKELLSINKEVYYYEERLREYKELLNDKKKLEAQLLATVRELPIFQRFMQKYSYLALLFPQPENYSTPAALAGLQTRTSVQGMISQRLGSGSAGGMNPQQYMSQQMQQGQAKMNELKEKLNQLGNKGGSDMTMPDFKPDQQHTKSFLQRLEYGFNIQSQRSTNWLPATSDIALTLGYKFSDKIVFGTGVSYKIGWGNGWNHFELSSQGVGLRSYLDIKAKGNLWISGGYEFNYMKEFSKFDDIKNIDVWQRSALMGLTKKIKIGKKRETKIQFLYDFLAVKQVPQASAFKFRIGYNF